MTTKHYYGDQSYESFYAGGPYKRELQREHDVMGYIKRHAHSSKKCKPSSGSDNPVLKTIPSNLKHGTGSFAGACIGKENKSVTIKKKKRQQDSFSRNHSRILKKPKTIPPMPQPIVNIDPQESMHLLLVEGTFPHGVDRLDYLSNVYYHQQASLLPNSGRCLDVLPPTKMTDGPWILVMPSTQNSLTLEDQRDWAGRRIRFASPKAATAKSLQNVRVSPTVDILGSLTIAAFSGFSAHEEFYNQGQTLARAVLQSNKTTDWSNTVAILPPFRIDHELTCAGGFSIAVNFDPSLHSYYLKIGICEALNEIVCVEGTITNKLSVLLTHSKWRQWSFLCNTTRFHPQPQRLARNLLNETSSDWSHRRAQMMTITSRKSVVRTNNGQ